MNTRKLRKRRWTLWLILTLVVAPRTVFPAEASFEVPPVLDAADLLDPSLMKGDHHHIEPQVTNDGFMNHFTIRSDFGTFEVRSQAMVPVRVREVQALAELKELSETDVFADALTASLKKPINAAKKIASDPVGTAKAVPEGVGRMFKKAALGAKKAAKKADSLMQGGDGERDSGEKADETAELAWEKSKDFIGYNSAKRALARRVGADPYSTNKVLQAELDRLAWAAFVGEVGIKRTVGTVPVQGELTRVSTMVWDLSPADLEVLNRDRLKKMGADGKQVDTFYDNPWNTPTVKTAIVELIDVLGGVAGRTDILDQAARVGNLDESLLFLASLKMLKDYHGDTAALTGIISETRLTWGMMDGGTVVVPVAVDHLVWTKAVTETVGAAAELLGSEPSVNNVELRVGGTVSSRTRRELESRGWTVTEKALKTVTAPE